MLGFQPLEIYRRTGANEQGCHFALTSMIARGRVVTAVHRPSQWSGVVFSIFQVQVGTCNQRRRQTLLAQQRCPMQRGFPE